MKILQLFFKNDMFKSNKNFPTPTSFLKLYSFKLPIYKCINVFVLRLVQPNIETQFHIYNITRLHQTCSNHFPIKSIFLIMKMKLKFL